MLIHSFLTNGRPMFEFAKLFLESLKYHNREKIKVILTGRDLSTDQIKELEGTYKNLDILNKSIDYSKLSKISGRSVSYIKSIKEQVEKRSTGIKDKDQLFWKQFVSVEDRYKTSITEVMERYKDYRYMLHLDIDICFSGRIDPLFEIIKNNDISVKYRNSPSKNRKIVGYCIGIGINNNSWEFMNRWIHHINEIPLVKKPKGYGQTTLWAAYVDTRDKIKVGDIPAWMTAHERNYKKKEYSPILLSGNKGSKTENIKKFSKIYREL